MTGRQHPRVANWCGSCHGRNGQADQSREVQAELCAHRLPRPGEFRMPLGNLGKQEEQMIIRALESTGGLVPSRRAAWIRGVP